MMIVAAIVVADAGLLLVGICAMVFAMPRRAEAFLRGFASSLKAHVLEQSVRLVAGAGLIVYSPAMRWSIAFEVFGWTLIATSVMLLVLPWRWHRWFASWAIPLAIRYMKMYGVLAGVLGGLILAGMM